MSFSSYIELVNLQLTEFSEKNNYNDYKCNVKLDFLSFSDDEVTAEIALTHFVLVPHHSPRLLKKNIDVLTKNDVSLLRISLCNSGLEKSANDNVVFEIANSECDTGYVVENLIYYPIRVKKENVFHVKLYNEYDRLIELYVDEIETTSNFNYFVACCFHLRNMSGHEVKCLRVSSFDEESKERYEDNTPIRFSYYVPEAFHEFNDFTNWEVAVHTLFISKELIDYFKTATFVSVFAGNISFFNNFSTSRDNSVLSFFKVKYKKKSLVTALRSTNLIYYDVTKRLLDEISLSVRFLNGANVLSLPKEDVKEEMFVECVLLFRRKK